MPNEIYIVDDNLEITQVLTQLLDSVGLQSICYHDGQSFLDAYQGQRSVLLLDLRLPTMSGLKVQETLQQQRHNIPIIFISGHGDISMAVKAIQRGALDFITKPFNNQYVIEAVQTALHHEHSASNRQQEKSIVSTRLAALTPRERQLLEGIVNSKRTKQIASELHISPNTAEVHRSQIMKKMEAKSLAHLITMVVKHNLIELHD